MIKIVPRAQLDSEAWDACVNASLQRIIYGYSWYLDKVLPPPNWKWIGLVLIDSYDQYQAVMPVPLRRKSIVGIYREWVVHQPFFCQFLPVFSPDASVDAQPFYDLMTRQFRYGSVFCSRQQIRPAPFGRVKQQSTHVLDLSVDYTTLYQNYSRDRQINLGRATASNWVILDSTDLEPLLMLFRTHHAHTIDGGVADWAYALFKNLFDALSKRGMARLQYATFNGRIEAGALFVQEGNRIIYLFNAASPIGRRGNARTLLIDKLVQEKAGQRLLFDFESPIKPSIRAFYQSFGSTEEPFVNLSWNRLSDVEKAFLAVKNRF